MSKLTVLGVLFFLLASLGFGFAFLNLNSSQTKPKNGTQQLSLPTPLSSPTNSPQALGSIIAPDGTIVPPVDLESDSVTAAALNYTFAGTIVEIKNVAEGLELITDIAEKGIPRLIICITCNQPTTVYFNDKGKFTQASVSDLKVDQEVRILSSYNLKNKQWSTLRVNILVRSISTTPQPQQ